MAVRLLSKSNNLTGVKFTRLNQFSFIVHFLVIAGGGGGGQPGGSGGAGGYRTSYGVSGGNSPAENPFSPQRSTNYTVTVGGGGGTASRGANSVFGPITCDGGGAGLNGNGASNSGGSSGGGRNTSNPTPPSFPTQGSAGGGSSGLGGGGGGGAGGAATSGSGGTGGNGGPGLYSSITFGAAVARGGGSGAGGTGSANGIAGVPSGGGQNGDTAIPGVVNTGAGGPGCEDSTPGAGGSGVVILRYPANFVLTVGAGLTASTTTIDSTSVTIFTAGTGTISWAG